ncbi:MAG: transcriptional repressor [Saccharofermentans sp.]|nr:transcriptional repressor [Saccharofermentans sp.]
MPIELSATDRLRESGIRVTVPRRIIFQYLIDNKTHPTCDRIYNDLKDTNSSLSLATVYNVTEKLVQENLVNVFVAPDGEHHYDSITEFHGHLYCEQCMTIFDFKSKPDKIPDILKGAVIKSVSYMAVGHCPECAKKRK